MRSVCVRVCPGRWLALWQPLVPVEDLVFGKYFSDHWLRCQWNAEEGWAAPRIEPYGNMSIDPACAVFHYALEVHTCVL